MPEEIDLSEAEEAALERAWERISREEDRSAPAKPKEETTPPSVPTITP